MSGAIASDAPPGLRLRDPRRVTRDQRYRRGRARRGKDWRMRRDRLRLRAERTFLRWLADLPSMRHQRSALCHIHHAVVLAIATAAGRQVRFAARAAKREKRLDQRQAKYGEQHESEQFSQLTLFNHESRKIAALLSRLVGDTKTTRGEHSHRSIRIAQ